MKQSYWQREAGWSDRWHNASMPTSVDVAIIGGGISGLATAIRLRELRPSDDIVLLEGERVGHGASGRNAGFLSPVAAPIWLLGTDRSADQAWGVARLNEEVHSIARWLSETVPESEIGPASLSIESAGTITDGGLSEFASALESAGVAHRLSPSRVRSGHLFLEMDAYTVHPYKLVRGLAEHAERLGVHIRERARVQALETAPEGARVRLHGGHELRARKVVVCTNAETSSIDLGERIRALVTHSFMLASAPLEESALRDIVRDADFTVELNTAETYHRLHGGRILYGGSDKILAPAGGDFVVPKSVQSHLAKRMHRSFPRIGSIAVTESWAGKLHTTATGLPMIRASKANPAVILNVGYGGTGVALALVLAPAVAALAAGVEPSSSDDARLLAVIQDTKIPVRDSIRAMGRLARRLTVPWLGS